MPEWHEAARKFLDAWKDVRFEIEEYRETGRRSSARAPPRQRDWQGKRP